MRDTAVSAIHVITGCLRDRVIWVVGEVLLAVLIGLVEVRTCAIAERLDVVPCRLAKVDCDVRLGEHLEDLTRHECCKHVILLRLDLLVLALLDETECIADVHTHVVERLKILRQNMTSIH